MQVLDQVPLAEPADRGQRGTPVERAVATGDRAVVRILGRLQDRVEERLVVIQRVVRRPVEQLPGADESDRRIRQVAEGDLAGSPDHPVVGVHGEYDVAIRAGESVIEVAGLTGGTVGPGEAGDAAA